MEVVIESQVRTKLHNFFYFNPVAWNQAEQLINGCNQISLYFLEQSINKKAKLMNDYFINEQGEHFFIYQQFNALREGYSSNLFDYHNRLFGIFSNRNLVESFTFHDKTIKTTLAILHFIYWTITTGYLDYVNKKYQEIYDFITNTNVGNAF